ncbi:hypothetical protein HDV00_010167, partial [Rhizophlyctis rosea]
MLDEEALEHQVRKQCFEIMSAIKLRDEGDPDDPFNLGFGLDIDTQYSHIDPWLSYNCLVHNTYVLKYLPREFFTKMLAYTIDIVTSPQTCLDRMATVIEDMLHAGHRPRWWKIVQAWENWGRIDDMPYIMAQMRRFRSAAQRGGVELRGLHRSLLTALYERKLLFPVQLIADDYLKYEKPFHRTGVQILQAFVQLRQPQEVLNRYGVLVAAGCPSTVEMIQIVFMALKQANQLWIPAELAPPDAPQIPYTDNIDYDGDDTPTPTPRVLLPTHFIGRLFYAKAQADNTLNRPSKCIYLQILCSQHRDAEAIPLAKELLALKEFEVDCQVYSAMADKLIAEHKVRQAYALLHRPAPSATTTTTSPTDIQTKTNYHHILRHAKAGSGITFFRQLHHNNHKLDSHFYTLLCVCVCRRLHLWQWGMAPRRDVEWVVGCLVEVLSVMKEEGVEVEVGLKRFLEWWVG